MTGHQDTILDLQALQELREDLEDAFVAFVQNFLITGRESIAKINQCLLSGATEDARQIAHSLKGSAGYLGAVRLSAQLEGLQLMAAKGEADSMLGALQTLRNDFEVLAVLLDDELV